MQSQNAWTIRAADWAALLASNSICFSFGLLSSPRHQASLALLSENPLHLHCRSGTLPLPRDLQHVKYAFSAKFIAMNCNRDCYATANLIEMEQWQYIYTMEILRQVQEFLPPASKLYGRRRAGWSRGISNYGVRQKNSMFRDDAEKGTIKASLLAPAE